MCCGRAGNSAQQNLQNSFSFRDVSPNRNTCFASMPARASHSSRANVTKNKQTHKQTKKTEQNPKRKRSQVASYVLFPLHLFLSGSITNASPSSLPAKLVLSEELHTQQLPHKKTKQTTPKKPMGSTRQQATGPRCKTPRRTPTGTPPPLASRGPPHYPTSVSSPATPPVPPPPPPPCTHPRPPPRRNAPTAPRGPYPPPREQQPPFLLRQQQRRPLRLLLLLPPPLPLLVVFGPRPSVRVPPLWQPRPSPGRPPTPPTASLVGTAPQTRRRPPPQALTLSPPLLRARPWPPPSLPLGAEALAGSRRSEAAGSLRW